MMLAISFLPTVRKVSSTELSLTEIEKPGKSTLKTFIFLRKKLSCLAICVFAKISFCHLLHPSFTETVTPIFAI